MLSRVANQLYWMGRYLERADHAARYINVEYFSSLDSSDGRFHRFALDSVVDMLSMSPLSTNEEEVLVSAALDENNSVSILSSVHACRENARGVRDHISADLWELINEFYHFVSDYPVDMYKTKGLHDFTSKVTQYCSDARGRIMHSMLHNDSWYFIQLGLYLERSAQVVRILISKNTDIEKFKNLKLGDFIESHHWTIVLDSVAAKDMFRKSHALLPDKLNTVDFLLSNRQFPKSVFNSLRNLKRCLERIETSGFTNRESVVFKVGKRIAPFEYLEQDDIHENLDEFLQNLLSIIYSINDLILEEYFE